MADSGIGCPNLTRPYPLRKHAIRPEVRGLWSPTSPGPRRAPLTISIYSVYTNSVSDDIYERLARCESFDWDTGNALKVVTRHRVDPGECEQAFFGEPFIVDVDVKHSQHEARWRALGVTLAGRRLYVVFTLRESRIRVIAARDMNRKERQAYDQIKARTQEDPDVQV